MNDDLMIPDTHRPREIASKESFRAIDGRVSIFSGPNAFPSNQSWAELPAGNVKHGLSEDLETKQLVKLKLKMVYPNNY